VVQPARRAQVAVGDLTVTYLPDGYGWLDPAACFPNSQPDGWSTHAEYLDETGRFPVSIGSFLIRSPDHAMLVDLGLGEVDFEVPGLARFRGGQLLDSLADEGLPADQIDTVVFTHLHHDHVGWTSNIAAAPNAPSGRAVTGLTFRNARHLVSEAEWAHWAGTAEVTGPDPIAVQQPLAAHIDWIGDGDEIMPGVQVRATPGHTPGHVSLIVTDPRHVTGDRLVILGDVLHSQVQVAESHWSFRFDTDAEQAVHTREQLLKELEDDATLVGGGHFAGHVFGAVKPARWRHAWSRHPR